MADKSVGELIAAQSVTPTDLFVLEQNGTAKKLTGQVLENWLVSFADGHGGIQSIAKVSTSGLVDTYRITLADTTTFDFVVTNGRSVNSISKYSTSGLVDTYRISYNDGTTSTFTITNGAKGDKGDSQYVWIKYASQQPTASSHSFGDVPDNWIGIYSGDSATAPTDWTQYDWFQIKGETGDTGGPATVISNVVEYQASDSGTIIPSGAWGTSIPVVSQGRYLWARTTTTFNTGSPAVSYSVSRMGIDGTGSVSSVAGISPNADGNVPLTASDVGALPDTGGDLTGELRMNGQPISGLNEPTENDQAANVGFVNKQVRKAAPRNLLDNSDFSNPVAQAGLNGRHGETTYACDRWINGGTTVEQQNGFLRVNTNNGSYSVKQMVAHNLQGKTITVACKAVAEKTFCVGLYYDIDGTSKSISFSSTTGANGIVCTTGIIPANAQNLRFNVYPAHVDDGGYADIYWAALYEGEYTAETLPEYHPKGYGVELAECQRYFLKGGDNSMWFPIHVNESSYINFSIPLPVTMRTTPTVVISTSKPQIFIDGTYYNLGTEGFNNISQTAGQVNFYGSASRFSNVSVKTGTSYIGRYSPDLSADL